MPSSDSGIVHIVGAGLAGLSGNHAALSFVKAIGSESQLQGPAVAEFPFVDLATRAQWTLRFSDGRIPWWVFDKDRRVPQTGAVDYLPLARLAWTAADRPIGLVMNCTGPIYERFMGPFLRAALNIAPRHGSSRLAGALVRETLARGGKACRPLLARDGIGNVFVEPAIRTLRERGVSILFQDELLGLHFAGRRISRAEFKSGTVTLARDDAVILAVPPYVAEGLLPGLRTPSQFRGIVNAHFRIETPDHLPPMLGVINGICEWIFAHPGRISVTISDAGRFFDMPREELAQTIWSEVAAIVGLLGILPPWQLVRERRATFAATPEQNAMRPIAETAWSNLVLAGDWTATGLPATLESAIRSGYRAADLVGHLLRAAA
ncbi:MAG: FAD-dependent oxidoreductase [Rhizobiales bacterium]|nr:FAD-dependent oxidoreductase [Hyphomicrobiales bacterium]